ncbi:YqiA/YcfP family alpha/beta fold hydrolase [Sediminicola sp. 1XM1-17]|uniref:YqiA/YcfP family alpha/beta fold hydrolase n=1 Tax=Sediminicola sp. 1XM1-17 TaxID=3127702 RepID=UPI0030782B5A
MNILYIHGLNGSLSDDKRVILETYGTVYSPSIDYEADSNSIEHLKEEFQYKDINVVMGSSMGGFVGYHLSIAFQRPALLFNPALVTRSVFQNIPVYNNLHRSFKKIVLGAQDDVVYPKNTLIFIADRINDNTDYQITLRQDLAHRIPLQIFKEEVAAFFNDYTI